MLKVRLGVVGLLLGLWLGTSQAQPPLVPKDGKVTIPLTLSPSPDPKPASRAYLLPEYKDSIPGNRVQMFMRLFMEQDRFFGSTESERREKWNAEPLESLPKDELKNYGGRLFSVDAVDAARMSQVDWQIWFSMRRDGYRTLLPEVQKMRAIAYALKTRLRGAIRNGDHWMAIETARTLFALAKTHESHPTLIGDLVGIAIAALTCDGLEELVQQPGCPNLFWSLTDLPVPFIDIRNGLQGERLLLSSDFSTLFNPDYIITEGDLKKILAQIDELVGVVEKPNTIRPGAEGKAPTIRYSEWAKDQKRVELARSRLRASGIHPNHVKAMSPLHATIADDVRRFEIARDDLFKWMNLPYWQAKQAESVEKDLTQNIAEMVLAPLLVPHAVRVKAAHVRLDQRIAFLRIIEAIRLYAHENQGKLPRTLDDIKLPLPVDPLTGKAFQYQVQDGTVTLTGANPNPGTDVTNRVYEIRIKK